MVEFANSPSRSSEGDDIIIQEPESKQNAMNGNLKARDDGEGQSRKKKRKMMKSDSKSNGIAKRRYSVSKPARDPRDNPFPLQPVIEDAGTRSPSPVIDFDGLSRPSKYFVIVRGVSDSF
jgi:GTP cyclohydrolase I